ncbi:hypothetical protein [Streptomyces sp. E1N211]|uniref:hypothetical protein n=1 Tax=Streptomyces sp. E1N211 TaxID=1851876 RepID=UPI0018C2A081|nr:hypothetical protein [Streptomyces sp. E1N211]
MTERRGYSPQGFRPEPTEAPPHGSPIAAPADADAFTEMHAKITAMHKFVKARAQEQITEPRFWESIGYALGAAEESLHHGDIVGAVRKLAWYRGEAERWRSHPDYPVEAAR